jgi:hypothetical protein
MKKYLILFTIFCSLLVTSCSSSGGGGGDEAPVIHDLSLFADPGDVIETTNYSIGDVIYLAFVVYDEDKDVKSAVLSVKDATTLDVIEPENEVAMDKQTDKEEVYYTYFSPDEAGTFKIYLYVKDKAGNTSNLLSKNLTVN